MTINNCTGQKASEFLESLAIHCEQPQWQPIEAAPNTGDVLLAWRGKYSDEWTFEVNETTKWDGFTRRPHLYATHWMPLPEPPHGV